MLCETANSFKLSIECKILNYTLGLYVKVTQIVSVVFVVGADVSSALASVLPGDEQEQSSVLFLKLQDLDRPSYFIFKLPGRECEFFRSERPLKLKRKEKYIGKNKE